MCLLDVVPSIGWRIACFWRSYGRLVEVDVCGLGRHGGIREVERR